MKFAQVNQVIYTSSLICIPISRFLLKYFWRYFANKVSMPNKLRKTITPSKKGNLPGNLQFYTYSTDDGKSNICPINFLAMEQLSIHKVLIKCNFDIQIALIEISHCKFTNICQKFFANIREFHPSQIQNFHETFVYIELVPFVNCCQYMYCFPFGLAGRMWDLIISVPDHCLSFYWV